jgi:hypothetical protein
VLSAALPGINGQWIYQSKLLMMKTLTRLTGIAVMLLLVANVLSAQVSIGLRGGINFTRGDLQETDVTDNMQEYLIAPYAAIPVEFKFGENFALQAEPTFIQKGLKLFEQFEMEDEVGQMMNYENDFRTRINYLTLPVLAKGLAGTENLRFYAVAGPEVGYALSGTKKLEMVVTNGEQTTEKISEDINFDKDGIDRFDFGLIFGAGVEAKLGPGAVVLDGRYNLGLYDIDRSAEVNPNPELYNRGIAVSIGYMLPLGK